MKIGYLAWQSLRYKALHTFLSVLILGFGCGLIMLVLAARDEIENRFTQDIAGIDMVVGAKGSPLQLILSSVYHIDAPTGNIAKAEFDRLAQNRLVKTAIPLSYGDNYRGYRILGTEASYLEHYKLTLRAGELAQKPLQAIAGARVAAATGVQVGTQITGSHGLQEAGDGHDEHPYTLTGILASCQCVADKLIITPLESVWTVHGHHQSEEAPDPQNDRPHEHSHGEDHHHEPHQKAEPPREITAGLLQFKGPMAQLTLPRIVNSQTNMQAALPAIELNRLFSLMGNAITFVNTLALLLLLLAAASVFIALYQNLSEEMPQLAYLRALGRSRTYLVRFILTKGLLIAFMGYALGWMLSKLGFAGLTAASQEAYQTSLNFVWLTPYDLPLLGLVLVVGAVAAFLPALRAARLNISKTLSNAN